ncbi:hypothetical protein FSP39_003142 [Pinctada imbricata]|uniref:Endoglucanase n=1 Tax=Pinctada imbricata TaxID=66713 RepID=A0AA89C7T3_PINIB|nr:hypothetical protein FSP39_003142 [Pinctada imbricata]
MQSSVHRTGLVISRYLSSSKRGETSCPKRLDISRKLKFMILLLALLALTHAQTVVKKWPGGMNGEVTLHSDADVTKWKAHIVFSQPIDALELWTSEEVGVSNGGKDHVVQGRTYNPDMPAGDMKLGFTARFPAGQEVPTFCAYLEGQASCGGGSSSSGSGSSSSGSGSSSSGTGTVAPTGSGGGGTSAPATSAPDSGSGGSGSGGSGSATSAPANSGNQGSSSAGSHYHGGNGYGGQACDGSPSQTRHDYAKALSLSILFYDAQRSGRLPPNNPVPWRGDSAVDDHGDNGVDLSGGWYDAGDLVKFNFPMAWSAHTLLWGLNKFKNGYQAAGQLDQMYDMIKTPLDYFLKCWRPNEQVYYAQVGDGYEDHKIWQRPEDMHMWRPAYKITASKPGTDVCAITAGAMAAGAIAFKDKDAGYSQKLLDSAKSLLKFANDHRGHYSNHIPAKDFYGSSSYCDDLCVGAVQIYLASGDETYLNQAKGFYEAGKAFAFSWDDNTPACQLLMYEATGDKKYLGDVEAMVRDYMDGGSVQHTPCGLAWRDKWGSLRYASNAAYIALAAADDGVGGEEFKKFALSQINYVLGDNRQHMSFEIGYGNNYPKKPHHKASSCNPGCSWNNYNSGADNPHVLNGALVGGPGPDDSYNDDRHDYTKNEVACDYNAGFQSALAALNSMGKCGNLPAAPNPKC